MVDERREITEQLNEERTKHAHAMVKTLASFHTHSYPHISTIAHYHTDLHTSPDCLVGILHAALQLTPNLSLPLNRLLTPHLFLSNMQDEMRNRFQLAYGSGWVAMASDSKIRRLVLRTILSVFGIRCTAKSIQPGESWDLSW